MLGTNKPALYIYIYPRVEIPTLSSTPGRDNPGLTNPNPNPKI